MNIAVDMPSRHDKPDRSAEAHTFAGQERRKPNSSARQSAVDARAEQMPKSCRATYLKVTRGKGSPRMAIKTFCLECLGWNRAEVVRCTATGCSLWMYRPFRRSGT